MPRRSRNWTQSWTPCWAGLLPLLAVAVAGGCAGAAEGADCIASSECASGLCYVNECLDPAADPDGDGLNNRVEQKLRSHPRKADSDDDGKLDGDEVGPNVEQPLDTDFDGKPNIVESLTADVDRDCLPDERDADDEAANTDLGLLKAIACSNRGVCAGHLDVISATCPAAQGGPAACIYDSVPGYTAVESCDGLDNDCDGLTDEDNTWQGLKVGQPCTGTGTCAEAVGAVVSCHGGKAACSSNPDGAEPAGEPELCDGVDNDCDGQTDELFAIDGLPVGAPCLGKGECGVGVVTCASGVALCSTMPGGPDAAAGPETCNDKDDDCDGATDEQLALGGVPLGAACDGVGACGPGKVVCGAQGAPVCSTDPLGPASEAAEEICNGLDDNCNGQTDEGLTYQGQPIGAVCWGVGACGKGTVVCSADGTASCSTMPGTPPAGVQATDELCNGKDDDCDGQTDEGFLYQGLALGQACNGAGACGAGKVECSAAGQVTCSSNPDGSGSQWQLEQCNNVDDDCDGVTDDDVPPTFGPKCPAKGVCIGFKGVPTCAAGAWSCVFPDATAFEAGEELSCDGKDNDCDGVIDEGLQHVWQPQTTVLDSGAPAARQGAGSCVLGGRLYVLGGRVQGPAKTLLSGELWRFDLAKRRWALLIAHPKLRAEGAALACLPKSGAAPDRLWRVGGRDSAAAPADPVELRLDNLALSSPAWSGLLQHRDNAFFTHDTKAGALWLGSRAPAHGSQPLQRLDIATATWAPAQAVPQPDFATNTDALCADGAGNLHALSRLDAAAIREHATYVAGKTAWQTLTPAQGKGGLALSGGALACHAGAVLLVGASSGGGATQTARWDSKSLSWQSSKLAPGPAGCPVHSYGKDLVAVGAGGWLTARHDVLKLPATDAALAAQKAVVRLDLQPEPARFATWTAAAGALYRIGGTACGGGGGCVHGGAGTVDHWRLAGGVWQSFAADWAGAPVVVGTPTIVADPDHGRLLIWGGDHPAVPGAPAGAWFIDLINKQWLPLKVAELAKLPVHLSKPLVSRHHPSDRAWLLGATAGGKRELVRVDLGTKASSALVWAGGASDGPTPSDAAVMLHDPVLHRLVVLEPGATLRAWALDLNAAKSWQVVGEDKSVSGGRVRLAGDAGMPSAIAVIAHPHNGPPPAARAVTLAAKVSFAPSAVQLGSLSGRFELVWQRNDKRALIVREDLPSGHPESAIRSLAWKCK